MFQTFSGNVKSGDTLVLLFLLARRFHLPVCLRSLSTSKTNHHERGSLCSS